MYSSQQLIDRVKRKCLVIPTGCWVYQGGLNQLGYAEASFNGKKWMVHRFMYWHLKGPFDKSLDCCHTCDNPSCVNPDHIWLGTPTDNSRDCVQKRRHHNTVKTHCPRGHAYSEHGMAHQSNPRWRKCRTCEGQRWQRMKRGEVRKRTPGVCLRGHKIEGRNIYPKPRGGKQCRICHDIAERRGRERRRA